MSDDAAYDSVFKTMVHKAPQLMIPLVNEVFDRDYPLDSMVTLFSDEHPGPRRTTIDDSVFRLQDKIYHVECQSTPDTDMVVRMIEYDFSIALEETLANGRPYHMDFPASCVLFLRHNSNTPDVLSIDVNLPDGKSFEYKVKVLKAQLVSSDDIFEKRLLVLLPYYLMRYEEELAEIAEDDEKSARLIAECTELRMELASQTLEHGDDLLYQRVTELIIRVSDHLLEKYGSLQKKVRAAMGGEVLELMDERAERMEREARERGLEEGREEGRAEGRAEGREEALGEFSKRLLELGVSEEVIAEAVSKTKGESKE